MHFKGKWLHFQSIRLILRLADLNFWILFPWISIYWPMAIFAPTKKYPRVKFSKIWHRGSEWYYGLTAIIKIWGKIRFDLQIDLPKFLKNFPICSKASSGSPDFHLRKIRDRFKYIYTCLNFTRVCISSIKREDFHDFSSFSRYKHPDLCLSSFFNLFTYAFWWALSNA